MFVNNNHLALIHHFTPSQSGFVALSFCVSNATGTNSVAKLIKFIEYLLLIV